MHCTMQSAETQHLEKTYSKDLLREISSKFFTLRTMLARSPILFLLVLYILGSNEVELFVKSQSESDILEFALNLEFLEADFFSYGSFGYGLDKIAPSLVAGGPAPVGATMANLSSVVKDIIAQFAYQEVGHIRFLIYFLL